MFNNSSALGVVLREFDSDSVTFQHTSNSVPYRQRHVAQHVTLVLSSNPKE